MLKVENLKKDYLRGNRRIRALQGISLSVEKGDFVHIIGKSGSGKSTLLNLITGLAKPTAGNIELMGQDLLKCKENALCDLRNTHIGVVSQGTASFPNLSVLENVMLPACIHFDKQRDVAGRAMHLLNQLDLKDLANAYPKELSGGEARRMLIARALMNEPSLLIADEPCSDLDAENSKVVLELFRKWNTEGLTIIMVSHDLDSLDYGNKVYTMVKGELFAGNVLLK